MYTDKEKQIFEYRLFPGGELRMADPVEVWWRLEKALHGELDKVLNDLDSPQVGISLAAAKRAAAAVCFAFNLGRPFDSDRQQGEVAMGQWLPLVREFNDWMEKKKTSTGTLPTCAPPMAAE